MAGAVKRFPDLVAAAAEADTDLLALKQSVANSDAEPVKWTLAACWAWILAKITANASAVRTALGLGTIATQPASSVNITGGSITGITDLAVTDGGTGASSASAARTNLGLVIGTDVQAQDAELAAIAGLTSAADKLPYFTGSGTAALADLTAAGRALLDDADVAAQLATLGLTTVGTTLGRSAVAVSHTGDTSETLLASVTVPANAMGANGRLVIDTLWSFTGSANSKTPRVRFSGAGGTVYMSHIITSGTAVTAHYETTISNRGATNSQVGGGVSQFGGVGTSTAALVTSSVDTTAATTVYITGQLASAGETITLEAYEVRLLP